MRNLDSSALHDFEMLRKALASTVRDPEMLRETLASTVHDPEMLRDALTSTIHDLEILRDALTRVIVHRRAKRLHDAHYPTYVIILGRLYVRWLLVRRWLKERWRKTGQRFLARVSRVGARSSTRPEDEERGTCQRIHNRRGDGHVY